MLRLLGHGIGVISLAAASVLLLRHLGVVRFGHYVTVMSIVAVASAVADAGLAVVGSRELALRPAGEERRRLIGNILGLRMLIAPLGVVGGAIFALLAGYSDAMVIGTLLAGVGLMLVTWQSSFVLGPIVELRNGRVTANEIVKQLTTVLGIAALVVAGATLTPFLAVPIAVGVVAVALSPVVLGRQALVRPRFDRDAWRMLVRQVLPVATVYVLATLYLRLVVVLMSLIATDYQTGLFGTSLRILETLIQIPTLLAGIALPLLTAAARDDHERLRYALQRISEVAIVAGALVVVVTVLAAETIVVVLGGEEFRPAAGVLRIQSVALLGVFLSQFWSAALIALHRQRELIGVNAAALVSLGVFAGVLIPFGGAKGGATVTVLGEAVLCGLLLWRLRRTGTPGQLRFGFVWRVLLAVAAGLAPLLIPELWVPAATALGVLLFAGAVVILRLVPEELLTALRRWR